MSYFSKFAEENILKTLNSLGYQDVVALAYVEIFQKGHRGLVRDSETIGPISLATLCGDYQQIYSTQLASQCRDGEVASKKIKVVSSLSLTCFGHVYAKKGIFLANAEEVNLPTSLAWLVASYYGRTSSFPYQLQQHVARLAEVFTGHFGEDAIDKEVKYAIRHFTGCQIPLRPVKEMLRVAAVRYMLNLHYENL